ncbi:MAG: thiolase family protein, partial [Propionibacteriaceae bacterium]|nr:thiolase family protein [Propionibacteriaceae bacterium]
MGSAFVYDALRTPFGKIGKGLADVRPDDLGAVVVKELVERNTDLDPATIDEVIFGNANGAGEENRNVARMATILAGLPLSVPGATVNRLCGSSLEGTIQASRAIETGDANIVVVGGVESMTRSPWIMLKPKTGYPVGDATVFSSTLGWRMINPRMPKEFTVGLGETAEQVADLAGIDRDSQDAFALRSHQLTAKAWAEGRFEGEVIAVPDAPITIDESMRADTSLEALAKLRPAFRKENGTVTAGNSSPLSDGASAVLVGAEGALPTAPLARIVSRGVAALEPNLMGIGPVGAANMALKRAGITWADVDFVEINEAFAAQVLACMKDWPELDPGKVNVDGGAIAIGHPLGASGGRLISHLARLLHRKGGGYGVATC